MQPSTIVQDLLSRALEARQKNQLLHAEQILEEALAFDIDC